MATAHLGMGGQIAAPGEEGKKHRKKATVCIVATHGA